ncbi:MAG: HD domain-containing protein, partial [Smithella sp.]
MLFAHSPDPDRGITAQEYVTHVDGVIRRASEAAEKAASYSTSDGDLLRKLVRQAAEYHDLGKLDNENQDVLSGKLKANKLPVQHTDAGTAYLLDSLKAAPSAALVRSHHIGLPDFVDEQNRCEESILRDDSVREKVNR